MTAGGDGDELLRVLLSKAREFQAESQGALAGLESSAARVVTLDKSYAKIHGLNVKQDELLRQSLRCVENELFRAAHVMAFASLMDFIEERLGRNRCNAVRKLHPDWKVKRVEDLREVGSDFLLIEALRLLKQCTKTQEKALKGLLNRRNECAHPSDYFPDLNETLGFISEIINRISMLQKAWGPKPSKRRP